MSSYQHSVLISDRDNVETEPSTSTVDLLCCCEYLDQNQERSHILTCCCNCVEFDNCFESFVCCRRVSLQQFCRTMFIISDKLRFPWRGGARRIPLDTIAPIILIPSLLYVAAHSVWYSFTIFMCLPLVLCYAHFYVIKFLPDTKFFLSWAITSIVLLFIEFQWNVVPILLITMEEYIIFLIFLLSSCYCFIRTKLLARACYVKNYSVLPSSSSESIVNISDDSVESLNTSFNVSETICVVCCKRVPPRTYHCNLCQACVYKRDLHCMWLDCCIGEKNHRYYMSGVFLLLCCLLFTSNLILTTVCSPVDVFLTVKMPRDCSEVYIDLMFAQYFVLAVYCVLISMFLLSLFIHEFYMICLGMTGHEWRISSHRKWYCLRARSVYSKGVWKNLATYFNVN